MPTSEEFEWPCDRRVAHGPHLIEWIDTEAAHDCDGTEESCVANCPVPIPVHQNFDCPGVLAHPATMIGGAYASVSA